MRGIITPQKLIDNIKELRRGGASISEISRITGKSRSVVSKYIQEVSITSLGLAALNIKQGSSVYRSKQEWKQKQREVESLFSQIESKDKLLILACLYWGEGTKKELNIINSDPKMLRVFVSCLKDLGLEDVRFKVTIRLYQDIDKEAAMLFWAQSLKLPLSCIKNFDILQGKKDGKLLYGMCRIRVERGAEHFKLIMSLIERIKILLP